MTSPFQYFAKSMIDFEQYRDSQYIATIKGLKNSYEGKKCIEVYPNVNIKIGDVLKNSNIDYYILDVDTQTWQGKVETFQAFYQTTPPIKEQPLPTVYNITSAQNSIIGNQQSVTINNSYSIEDLKQLIELYGQNDKQQLYELTSLLKETLDKDEFHKSKLAKFGDLLAKHSWLPLAISQIIAGYLSH